MAPDNAHKILDIYAYFKAQPGDTLISTADELDAGLDQAFRSGWIARAAEGGWQLTETGFEEASVAKI